MEDLTKALEESEKLRVNKDFHNLHALVTYLSNMLPPPSTVGLLKTFPCPGVGLLICYLPGERAFVKCTGR